MTFALYSYHTLDQSTHTDQTRPCKTGDGDGNVERVAVAVVTGGGAGSRVTGCEERGRRKEGGGGLWFHACGRGGRGCLLD